MTIFDTQYVVYLRVSTTQQGRSGLGLDAQRAAVQRFLGAQVPLAEFVEVESGRGADSIRNRPELQKALALCKQKKATLLIAALDRLARSVHVVSGLMESGVDFRAVDLPGATRLTLHIHAALAEEEGHKISERTRNALAEAKKRGTKLGNPTPTRAARRGGEATKKKASQFAANTLPIVREIQRAGVDTLAGIAEALRARGIATPRGGNWTASAVRNLLRREEALRGS